MTEDNTGARVTIRKRSNSGEGAAIGGAEPARNDASGETQREGRLTAVTFHLTPLPRYAGVESRSSVIAWATGRIERFFGRSLSVDEESGALHFHDGPWPASTELAKFADALEVEAERRGYRCTCESTLRW